MGTGRIVMGLLFFPRGGSAQVTRYLAAALGDAGWTVSLATGSLGLPGDGTHAPTFFAGLDEHHLDYTAAVEAFTRSGTSAVAAAVPMHPSYEDREGAPDVVLAAVDPALAAHLVAVWEGPFTAAGADQAELFHLHHLTSQHDLVARRWPGAPVLAHLHGTEIKLLEAIDVRAAVAEALGRTLADMADAVEEDGRRATSALETATLDEAQRDVLRTTRWTEWRYGEHWARALRRRAATADHLVAVSPTDRETAISILGVPSERITAVPNGVDTDLFAPRALERDERRHTFRRWLVEEPQGWDESGIPGSVAYREADLDRLLGEDGETAVLMFIGRFTAAKRVPLLIEAFTRARARASRPSSLLVWGGHPGEWEDEHPVVTARRHGGDGVFFAGWRGHHDLPLALAACDGVVMPSVNDSYPQAPLEAMAAARPVIATRSGGFPLMVNLDPARPTGWLCEPDDVESLADALLAAIAAPAERLRRGAAARDHAVADLSWKGRVARFEEAYSLAQRRRGGVTAP